MKATRFLLGEIPDNSGRYISDYHKFTFEQMEKLHDYIQWMFPISEPSAFNIHAPILTKEEISKEAAEVIKKNLSRFIAFLKSRDDIFETQFDHNHMRISRVIKCLRLFRLGNELLSFVEFLNSKTFDKNLDNVTAHWIEAIKKDLWNAN